MRWRWWRRPPPPEPPADNGAAAARAKAESERRLRETRRDWPKVHRAADDFAALMDAALRGRGT
jgi:hypothetical protein